MTKSQKVLFGVLIVIIIGLVARFVVFKEQFDAWGEGLDRIGAWQDEYRQNNLNASKDDMDREFENGMNGLKVWQEKYKQDNPNATKAEMDAAFNSQWGG